ncbi:hypothetical protein CJU89_6701 [Yarrowia sp. B02]|nr:hypothetical protein CJU89_6701 [Yarrowia sp. B02]
MDEVAFQRHKSYITSYECVSAVGKALPPLVVFKNRGVEDGWVKENMPGHNDYILFDNHASKLKPKKLIDKWLKEIILPKTVPANKDGWRLLIWDDNTAHDKWGYAKLFEQHKVRLVTMHCETVHFSAPVESTYTPEVKDKLSKLYKTTSIDEDKGEGYEHRWLKMIHEARTETFALENHKKAWIETGCFPPDEDTLYKQANEKRIKKPKSQWVIMAV